MGRGGKIITFYSYKGGTGRSMALANIAWILASHQKNVLMIDWDLEAPGLHRYFHPFLIDPELTSTEGLIDFVWNFAIDAVTPPVAEPDTGSKSWAESAADLTPYTCGLEFDFGEGRLDFVPAGRQGPEYSARVNAFNWMNFYTRLRGGVLLEAVRKRLKRDYDFVLVDSRTGVSDTSGICTVQMPDQLVVCFTCNNQSIRGAAAVVESILEQREKSGRGGKKGKLQEKSGREDKEEEELQIFPVLMRVDLSEKDKLDASRSFARKTFLGYPNHLGPSQQERYWRKSEILYHSYYAYEEILTVFGDSPDSDKTLLSDVETLVGHLTNEDINELNKLAEPTRLAFKAKFLRAEAKAPRLFALRDPQSIALYGKVKGAKEEWERAGRSTNKLLPASLSRELSFAAEVRNELIQEESVKTFVEDSAIVNKRRWIVTLSLCLAFILGGIVLPLWVTLNLLDALYGQDIVGWAPPLVIFAVFVFFGLAVSLLLKAFRAGRLYDTLLGIVLRKPSSRA